MDGGTNGDLDGWKVGKDGGEVGDKVAPCSVGSGVGEGLFGIQSLTSIRFLVAYILPFGTYSKCKCVGPDFPITVP